jgi:hypothetical protein
MPGTRGRGYPRCRTPKPGPGCGSPPYQVDRQDGAGATPAMPRSAFLATTARATRTRWSLMARIESGRSSLEPCISDMPPADHQPRGIRA